MKYCDHDRFTQRWTKAPHATHILRASGNSKCFQSPCHRSKVQHVWWDPPVDQSNPKPKLPAVAAIVNTGLRSTPQKVLARTSKRPRSLNGNGRRNTGVQIILHNAVLDSTFSRASQFRNTWSCKEHWRSPVPKKGGLTTTKLVHRPTNPLRDRAQRISL